MGTASQPSTASVAALLLLLLLPLLHLAAGAVRLPPSTSTTGTDACLPVTLSIQAPGQTRQGSKSFQTRIRVVNDGSSPLLNLVLSVRLPVEAATVKASLPALHPAQGSDPWTLLLPIPSLPPSRGRGKKKALTVKIEAVIGRCFQGSAQLAAAVSAVRPTLDAAACPLVEVTRTVCTYLPTHLHADWIVDLGCLGWLVD